jgi:hypothetical protein
LADPSGRGACLTSAARCWRFVGHTRSRSPLTCPSCEGSSVTRPPDCPPRCTTKKQDSAQTRVRNMRERPQGELVHQMTEPNAQRQWWGAGSVLRWAEAVPAWRWRPCPAAHAGSQGWPRRPPPLPPPPAARSCHSSRPPTCRAPLPAAHRGPSPCSRAGPGRRPGGKKGQG